MIQFNLKLAIRNLAKNKIYSFLIIGSFAIGFAACILIGLFYYTETTVNKDFVNHKQIYRLYDVKKNMCNLNWDMFPILKQDYAVVKDACPLDYATGKKFIIKNEADHTYAEIKHLLTTTNNFFSMFSVDLAETSGSKPFEGKESMLLSKAVARKLFGSQNPLGRQVNLENNWVGTVTGIFNELPQNSSFQADIIMNGENEKFRLNRTISNGKRYNPTNHFVVLKEGTNPETFANEINKSTTIKSLDINTLSLQALDDIYLSKLTVKSRHAKGNPSLLKIFLAIAVLILLLSSINYLSYSISMKYAKLKEIGINKTNGANWRNLISYTLVEVSLGIIVSLLLAATITFWALPYTDKLFGKVLQVDWQACISVFPIFFTIIVVVILINSLAPIYILSKFRITEFLS
ncbi:MAG TPA: ABC transporter permease, partial [Bacteroidales bacterium]